MGKIVRNSLTTLKDFFEKESQVMKGKFGDKHLWVSDLISNVKFFTAARNQLDEELSRVNVAKDPSPPPSPKRPISAAKDPSPPPSPKHALPVHGGSTTVPDPEVGDKVTVPWEDGESYVGTVTGQTENNYRIKFDGDDRSYDGEFTRGDFSILDTSKGKVKPTVFTPRKSSGRAPQPPPKRSFGTKLDENATPKEEEEQPELAGPGHCQLADKPLTKHKAHKSWKVCDADGCKWIPDNGAW